MESVRWDDQPGMGPAVLIAAFEGWNDAGDAASVAARFLAASWDAHRFGTIDPEEFYDFTSTRPQVKLREGVTREVVWPEGELWVAKPPDSPRPVIFVHAVEPQLRWRTYTEALVEVAEAFEVEMAVTLGALLADVPHTHPVRVTGTAADADLVARLGLQHSRYEGPTGIVGVLQDAFGRAGIPSASLWATVPHYLSATPSPRAALALVDRVGELFDTPTITLELEVAAAAYDRQVDEVVEDDDDLAAYVRQLEDSAADQDRLVDSEGGAGQLAWPPPTGNLAAEAERFLREQPPD
ncbi:MAG TPA: PAC2 family protein [Acidimicrobiales bacterium]|nr:PAC2 family protein [Acidimicrobiales bacterium]